MPCPTKVSLTSETLGRSSPGYTKKSSTKASVSSPTFKVPPVIWLLTSGTIWKNEPLLHGSNPLDS